VARNHRIVLFLGTAAIGVVHRRKSVGR